MVRTNPRSRRRYAKILVLCAILLGLMVGMVGLVIDAGRVMATYRQVHNAADGAALAAAMHLLMGDSADITKTDAETYVKTYNGLSTATVVVNLGAEITEGPHANNPNYAEVRVSYPVDLTFMRIFGVQQRVVSSRAVAGWEALGYGEGAIVLDPRARPGLSVDGGATLKVNGTVIVNSGGAGNDQYGEWVDRGMQQYALTASNNSTVMAKHLQVYGGVDVVANYKNYDENDPRSPLFARGPIAPDPLKDLPIPTDKNGVIPIVQGPLDKNGVPTGVVDVGPGEYKELEPGLYHKITIGGSAKFKAGIYVLMPQGPDDGLKITTNETVIGDGVMFYFAGSNYLYEIKNNGQPEKQNGEFVVHEPGKYDILDGSVSFKSISPLPPDLTLPPAPDPNVKYGSGGLINATNAQNFRLTGINDKSSPFDGVLFFQRRRNDNMFNIQGNAGDNFVLGGTIYARLARFQIAGDGKYDSQFVVGSMSISGQGTVILHSTGKNFQKAGQVFLVE